MKKKLVKTVTINIYNDETIEYVTTESKNSISVLQLAKNIKTLAALIPETDEEINNFMRQLGIQYLTERN